jgi:3',5'-cyclic AMP phosphodiesterase CpdA
MKKAFLSTSSIKIAHISDVHVWQPNLFTTSRASVLHFLRNNSWKDLKQIQGYLNVQYNRGPDAYPSTTFIEAMKDMKSHESIQHMFITGDLTNIALYDEFKRVRELLNEYYLTSINEDPSLYASVIPGNHDTYTHEAVDNDYFGKWFSDLQGTTLSNDSVNTNTTYDHFPNIKVLSNESQHIVVIGLCSGRPTKPFYSAGQLGEKQLSDMQQLLSQTISELQQSDPKQHIYKIVLMHHPPVRRHTKSDKKELMHGLAKQDIIAFEQFCNSNDINLVLNGHTHTPMTCWLPYGTQTNIHKTLVIDPGSGTYNDKTQRRTARYNVYEIAEGQLVNAHARVFSRESNTFNSKDLVLPSY